MNKISATERLERWIKADPGWRGVTKIQLAENDGIEVTLRDYGRAAEEIVADGPTLDAAIHAALDAAGAE